MLQDKEVLRKEMRAILKNFSADQVLEKSLKISHKILQLVGSLQSTQYLAGFSPLKTEPQIQEVAELKNKMNAFIFETGQLQLD